MNKEELFRKAIAENESRIYRICSYYFSDTEDRNDAFQNTLIRIWEAIGTFRNQSKISTWIYRIAVNTCLSAIRSEKRRQGLLDHTKSIDDLQMPDTINFDNEKDVEGKLAFFNKFMQKISAVDRILVSIYLEGIDTKEMAEITGLSEANVRVKIHRIKELIKKEWEERKNGT